MFYLWKTLGRALLKDEFYEHLVGSHTLKKDSGYPRLIDWSSKDTVKANPKELTKYLHDRGYLVSRYELGEINRIIGGNAQWEALRTKVQQFCANPDNADPPVPWKPAWAEDAPEQFWLLLGSCCMDNDLLEKAITGNFEPFSIDARYEHDVMRLLNKCVNEFTALEKLGWSSPCRTSPTWCAEYEHWDAKYEKEMRQTGKDHTKSRS